MLSISWIKILKNETSNLNRDRVIDIDVIYNDIVSPLFYV